MIGDSWDVDIVGAMNFGIDQVHFDPGGVDYFTDEEINTIKRSRTTTYRINNIKQLTVIL